MAHISQSFIMQRNIEDLIRGALRQIGEFLDVQRLLVVVMDSKKPYGLVEYSWTSSKATATIDYDHFQQMNDSGEAASSQEELSAGMHKMCCDALTEPFPPVLEPGQLMSIVFCSNTSKDFSQKYLRIAEKGVKSFVWAPIYTRGVLWGVLCIEELHKYRAWNENEEQLIASVNGALSGVVARYQIEQEHAVALETTIKASQAKSEFLSKMSHEMRTPMNAIIGMTTIAQNSDDPERKEYCLEKISGASQHLLGIINDVLDMSKIDTDDFRLSSKPFRFIDTIKDSIDMISPTIETRKQKLEVFLDRRIPPILIGDAQRLSQVLVSLLGNAVKFTSDGGEITLKMRFKEKRGEKCVLYAEVIDTGIGISKEQQTRLFKSFEQIESGSARRFGGTGLGLAISKHIVELMHGEIGVTSSLGEGSTFFFTVEMRCGTENDLESALKPPAVKAADPAGVRQDDTRPEIKSGMHENSEGVLDLSAYRILLAEDVEINREVVISLLENTGIQIESACNGVEAVNKIQDDLENYDLIFMDMQMPEMDGLHATQIIRQMDNPKAREIPIVALTANVFKEDIEKTRAVGMNDHIGKPIVLDEMMRTLVTYLPAK